MRTVLHGTCLLNGVHPVGSEEWKACPVNRRRLVRAGQGRPPRRAGGAQEPPTSIRAAPSSHPMLGARSRAVSRLMEEAVMLFLHRRRYNEGGEATFGYDCGRDPR